MNTSRNHIHFLFFLLCLFFPVAIITAQPFQRYNTFSYGVNEGLLQSTITSIEIDDNNFCWIGYPNGIQKFDGTNFTDIPVQAGLPETKNVNFFKTTLGDLVIIHARGLSVYNIKTNSFKLVYSHPGIRANLLGEDDGVLYFFYNDGLLRSVDVSGFIKKKEIKLDILISTDPSVPQVRCSDNIVNHRFVIENNAAYYLYDLQQQKIISQRAGSPVFSNFLHLSSAEKLLFFKNDTLNSLEYVNFTTGEKGEHFSFGSAGAILQPSIFFEWKGRHFFAVANRLFQVNEALTEIQATVVNFQNKPISGSSSLRSLKKDKFENLYIATVNAGIVKVIGNTYEMKYYGLGGADVRVMSLLPDKAKNRVMAGLERNGLLVFDTLQQVVQHILHWPGEKKIPSVNAILKDNADGYLLFAWGINRIFHLDKNLKFLPSIPIRQFSIEESLGTYFGHIISKDTRRKIVQQQGFLIEYSGEEKTALAHYVVKDYILSGIHYRSYIVLHSGNNLLYLDDKTFREVKRIPFPYANGVRCFSEDSEGNLLVGSNNGIFRVDAGGKILNHLDKRTGLPDDCIYAMLKDDSGLIWCSTNKGIFRLAQDNKTFLLTRNDGLQDNEFNTNVAAKAEDGELFFGGINGMSSFYASDIKPGVQDASVLVTNVLVNNAPYNSDTAANEILHMRLPYNRNSLSFSFLALGSYNPDQYIYQYRLLGLDTGWVKADGLQAVRYVLQPGKYTFQVYASRQFDAAARPLKEISVLILQPLWKRWWFIALGVIITLALLTFIINQRHKKNYNKKILQLQHENELKQERERISRDLHDNLGAYANAVLYHSELLGKENSPERRLPLLEDIKFASKDVITSLRETVWALKQESYTAEECLVRIRNFMQPLSRYYKHIQFTIEGQAPVQQMHYSKALNLVRMVQEAITNAIKHSGAAIINVKAETLEGCWAWTIADNGQGFDLGAAGDLKKGNGLANMEQRAQTSGFEYEIVSEPGSGTTVTIKILPCL